MFDEEWDVLIDESEEETWLKERLRINPVWSAYELAKELPSMRDVLAKLLLREEVSAHVDLEVDGTVLHLAADEVFQCGNTVCIAVKYSSWSEAEDDAYLLRKAGYRARVDYETDKPYLIVELKPNDVVRFTISDIHL